MTKNQPLHTFVSIAPFRTPFSSNSELRGEADNQDLLKGLKALAPLDEAFEINDVDWVFGYGTTQHDHVPNFFRPFAILTPKKTPPDPAVEACEIHIYDDGIGVMFLRWSNDICPRLVDSEELWTRLSTRFFAEIVKPVFDETIDVIEAQHNGASTFLKPSALILSTALTELPKEPYWVARAVLSPTASVFGRDMLEWVYSSPNTQPDPEDFLFAGSGNSFLVSPEQDRPTLLSDFYRAMSFCQFYASLVERYQLLFRSDFRSLKEQKVGGISHQLKDDVEARLDHLDFVNLQYERARAGFQGRRITLISTLLNAWGANAQLENTMGWATVLKKRLERDLQNRQIRQGRIIKALIAFVGGLSLLDLALILVNEASRHKDDGVPGLLDLVRNVPADFALYLAIIVLALAMFLTAFRE
ncbi:hypothetical protein RKLH11_357 [Rhodobacteraceae bacterium KLH11]|nr:hypothetical protein RKLH11_357 [Rhodobacteraceae bacterium KLH11]